MRYGTPFDFRRSYASSNGSQIWEVTHDADKPKEERTNPPSWIALMESPWELAKLKESGTLPLQGEVSDIPHTQLTYGPLNDAYELLTSIAKTGEAYELVRDATIPTMGLLHHTYESALLAIEVGNTDPTHEELLEIHNKMAKRERNSTAFFMALNKAERNMQPVADFINDAIDQGKFFPYAQASVEHTGGGCMAVTVYKTSIDKGIDGDGPHIMFTDMSEEGSIDTGIYTNWEDEDAVYGTIKSNDYPELDLYHDKAPELCASFLEDLYEGWKRLLLFTKYPNSYRNL